MQKRSFKTAALLAAMMCVSFTGCSQKNEISKPNIVVVSESSSAKSSSARSSTPQNSSTRSTTTQSTSTHSSSSQITSTQTAGSVSESTAAESAALPTLDSEFDSEFFNDALFIGDSIFTGIYLYGYLPREIVAAEVGYTAYSAQVNPFDATYYPGSAVDYARERSPKKIIIMLGTNSLSPYTDMDDFENGYRGLLSGLKEACPNSVICAVSVPPVTADSSGADYSGVTNAIIDTANDRIKSLCGEMRALYYDFNSAAKDENGFFREDLAEADGMHFMGATYPVLFAGVQKVLEQ